MGSRLLARPLSAPPIRLCAQGPLSFVLAPRAARTLPRVDPRLSLCYAGGMNASTIALVLLLVACTPGCRDEPKGTIYGPPCSTKELARTLEWCAPGKELSPCVHVPAELGESCQAGCVLQMCEDTAPGSITSLARSTSCSDNRGPLYWRNFFTAAYACETQHGRAQPARGDCATAEVEKQCPELAGTSWAESWPGRYR
jgi:hypothetical protein